MKGLLILWAVLNPLVQSVRFFLPQGIPDSPLSPLQQLFRLKNAPSVSETSVASSGGAFLSGTLDNYGRKTGLHALKPQIASVDNFKQLNAVPSSVFHEFAAQHLGWNVTALSRSGNKFTPNQDNYFARMYTEDFYDAHSHELVTVPTIGVFAIFDGHSFFGHEASAFCIAKLKELADAEFRFFYQTTFSAFFEQDPDSDYPAGLQDAMEEIIRRIAHELNEGLLNYLDTAGATTFAMAVWDHKKLYTASSGDSPIYRINPENRRFEVISEICSSDSLIHNKAAFDSIQNWFSNAKPEKQFSGGILTYSWRQDVPVSIPTATLPNAYDSSGDNIEEDDNIEDNSEGDIFEEEDDLGDNADGDEASNDKIENAEAPAFTIHSTDTISPTSSSTGEGDIYTEEKNRSEEKHDSEEKNGSEHVPEQKPESTDIREDQNEESTTAYDLADNNFSESIFDKMLKAQKKQVTPFIPERSEINEAAGKRGRAIMEYHFRSHMNHMFAIMRIGGLAPSRGLGDSEKLTSDKPFITSRSFVRSTPVIHVFDFKSDDISEILLTSDGFSTPVTINSVDQVFANDVLGCDASLDSTTCLENPGIHFDKMIRGEYDDEDFPPLKFLSALGEITDRAQQIDSERMFEMWEQGRNGSAIAETLEHLYKKVRDLDQNAWVKSYDDFTVMYVRKQWNATTPSPVTFLRQSVLNSK